jgi:NAD(P)H-flavin reductase
MPRNAVVKKRVFETRDTVSLTLALADGGSYSFGAGQFNMLGLPGFGEAPISFSSLINEGGEFVHTIRLVGNVTREICSRRVGDLVQLRGPFGNGWPLEKAYGKNLIIVAGGIGMAPLRPVIQHVVRDRKNFGRVFILYGARTVNDILYGKELKKWGSARDVTVHVSVDEAPPKARPGLHVGVVTTLFDLIDAPLQESVTFTCGPEIMMRFVALQLLLKGQRPCDIFISMERRMKCGIGHCGHCQIGAKYVCKDGPVFPYGDIKRFVDTLL